MAGGLAVFEFEANFAFVAQGFEEVEHVTGVETYHQRVAGVGGFYAVFGFAGLVGLGCDLDFVLLHLDADGAAALIGELGYAADASGELGGAHDDEAGVVAGHDGFVVGELAGELAAGERAMADAEEEPEIVVGELYVFSFSGAQKGLQLGEGFAGDKDALFSADAVENLFGLLYEAQAMTVCRYHGDGFGFQDQERAVEGVTGFFIGDAEDGAGDEGLQDWNGDLDAGYGGQLGDLRVVGAS